MKAVKSNLLKLARVPLDIGGQFPSWSLNPRAGPALHVTDGDVVVSMLLIIIIDTWMEGRAEAGLL